MKRNIIAISLMAAGLFTFGNVYADTAESACGADYESSSSVACTLSEAGTFDKTKIDKPVTIDAKGYTVTLSSKLTITETGSLTIVNGTLVLNNSGEIVIKGGSLTIKDATKRLEDGTLITAIAPSSSSNKITVTNGGSLTISNVGRGFGNGQSNIVLKDGSTFTATGNSKNVINGGTLIAQNSTINVTDNQEGGLSAIIKLTNSTITANKNGLSGVTFQAGSSIDANSTVTATGNNWNSSAYNPDRTPSKADVLFDGETDGSTSATPVTIAGKLIADTIAPVKNTWDDDGAGKLRNVKVVITGTVDVNEVKAICEGIKATACIDPEKISIDESKSTGLLLEGDTATIYGNNVVSNGYKFESDVKTISIAKTNKVPLEFEVAGGTSVINASSQMAVVKADGETVVVEPAKAGEEPTPVVIGTAKVDDQQNNGQTGNQAGSDNGTDDNTIDDSPKTYDGIMSYVTMALTSIGAVALSLKKVLSR